MEQSGDHPRVRASSTAPLRQEAAVAATFLLLTVAMTWPLARLWAPVLPDAEDAHFNVWRLAWIARQLRVDPTSLFDGNIFFPATNTLALSDAVILPGLLAAPMIWAGLHPFVVHNLVILGSFWLAAYCGYRLSARLTRSVPAAVIGGIVMGFAPYRFGHIAHLELLWTALLALATLAFLQLMERPSVAAGLRLALFHVLQTLCSVYYGVFLAVYLAAGAAVMLLWQRRRHAVRAIGALLVAAVATAIVLSPYIARYRLASQTVDQRPREEIARFSAIPADYLRGTHHHLVHRSPLVTGHEERALHPGFVAAVLGLIGLATGGRVGLLFGVLLAVSVDLSFGLHGLLYPTLLEMFPPLAGLRAPARFGAFVILSLSALVALGVGRLMRGLGAPGWLAAALAGAIILEYAAVPIPTRVRPTTPPPLYAWLAAQPPGVVLELPVPTSATLWGDEVEYQLMSIYHWKPLVNGYSGSAPGSYIRTLDALANFPDPEGIEHVRRIGVRWVVLHRANIGESAFADLMVQMLAAGAFRPVGTYDDGFGPATIFELQPELQLPAM
jgi:hypothetical protein